MLHEYQTSVHTSIGENPFSLVYGMEAVLPVEVEIPLLRVSMETKLEKVKWVYARFNQLNRIEEKWMTMLFHGQLKQRRLKKPFNKKVHPWEFQEGDLVLKKIMPIHKDSYGKWIPNYEGLFIMNKAFSWGALVIPQNFPFFFFRFVPIWP